MKEPEPKIDTNTGSNLNEKDKRKKKVDNPRFHSLQPQKLGLQVKSKEHVMKN